jgi:NAD+ synthase (glutamine-hydrolysing)
LVVFPESVVFGYHPFDLLERTELVVDQIDQVSRIQKRVPEGIAVLLGVITENKKKKGRPYFNSAVLLQKGKRAVVFNKELLPTGDVFDEARFIESGKMENNFFKLKGNRIFVTICEDIWAWPEAGGRSHYLSNPIDKIGAKDVDLVVNLSASPYFPGKVEIRKKLVTKTAKKFKSPMVYCNLVGAQDEIIFDGASFAVDASGKVVMQSQSFEEELNFFDLNENASRTCPSALDPAEELRAALVLGIRDFCQKTGLKKIHLGLSGGVDSALVACLAVEALGPAKVSTFALPSEFNAQESLVLAKQLSNNIGVSFQEISIQNIFSTFKNEVDSAFNVTEFGVVHENLQARIRGTLLMAYANLTGSLLLTTSNKSEYAAGYSTLYGDMCGGLAPIGDLTKSQVYAICDVYNRDTEVIPRMILTRDPSAELRPNQRDQDFLPPYAELDQSVVRLIERGELLKTKTDEWLFPLLLKTEFKRWQAPPILKVSAHSFGRGRRWPVAQKIK